MSLSIAICTRNRAPVLAQTLEDVLPQLSGLGADVELVVIANDVSDETLEVCRRHGVACVEEPRRGLSHARNTSIAATTGAAILWIDDDATPEPGCIDAYLRALEEYPQDAFFGGPIRPEFAGTPPEWAQSALSVIPTVWAGLDLGRDDRPFRSDRHEYPFGANMVVRRSALVEPFRSDVGRNGDGLVGGEESALFRALKRQGMTGRWVAAAGVRHRIDPERQTLDYVRRYFAGQGIQRVVLGDARKTLGIAFMVRGGLGIAARGLRYLWRRAACQPADWLSAYADLHTHVGLFSARFPSRARTEGIEGGLQ